MTRDRTPDQPQNQPRDQTPHPAPHPPAEPTRDLAAALRAHADGEGLAAVWDALPRVRAGLGAASSNAADHFDEARAAAWARLHATISDPMRVPFTSDTDDPPAPLTLVVEPPSTAQKPASGRIATAAPARITAAATPRGTQYAGPSVRRWLAAASVVLATGAGVAGVRALPVTYEAAVASGTSSAVSPVRLADGSDVWLAPGSSISVPRALGWPGWTRSSARMVRLTGRAFFAVERDGRPFSVHTPDATVVVLGTRFEVRGPFGATGSAVMVEEGRVAVSGIGQPSGAAPTVELSAGQRAVVGSAAFGAGAVGTVPVERIASWRTGGLAALDEPLDAVLDELARRFDVEITVDPALDVSTTVSLFYPLVPSVDSVLSDLCTAQGLTFRRTSRGYHIARSGTQP